jgi:broad specificity phosphatase PhoE
VAIAESSVEAGPSGSASTQLSSGPAIVLVRHGQTEWSKAGLHTGRTDVALTAAGEDQARAAGVLIRALLGSSEPSLIVSSPRQRALQTAELAGYSPMLVTEAAAEWDYGDLEGLSSAEIQQSHPGWSIWAGPVPGGEDAAAVTKRIDGLLEELRSAAADGPVVVFSHGHASRCIAARWLDEPVTAGRHYWLNTGAVSSLGYEHGRPVLLRWNLDKSVISSQG